MTEPVLVIMAAGMGSRYGGLKQIDPIDGQGNLIIDFSIYDALRAGFQKVIFIIKREIEEDFKERIGNRIAEKVAVEYIYQELDNLPEGFSVPEDRKKPWGTGHAVLSCKEVIGGPFAVINADDYYGRQAFSMIYDTLLSTEDNDKFQYAMVGYGLMNTLTEHGHVARGVCRVDADGMLKEIEERVHIEKQGEHGAFTEDNGSTWQTLDDASIVSMNLWGFHESILSVLEAKFKDFLENEAVLNPLKAEYFLPSVVDGLIKENKAEVRVLKSPDKWYGVTYKEDKERVVKAIQEFKEMGIYPEKLWI